MPIKYTRSVKPEVPKSNLEKTELKETNKEVELQPNNPLHGVKLADILNYLVEYYGWESLGQQIKINCFNSNPSINSSLKFLRRTNWAREKVERLYIKTLQKKLIRSS